ncbi:hypothetical protein EJ08DRAFT_528400 [Tothia fuscella]|uniref:MD-2-related lipid-recognition domain-containing protein n=1 Tax=Tothia fuscella TaxID=1048955 RepID=A0A9P4NGK5_9PEZI|nr:hypothetical protein EJ08DRAFT_528400 [Tothia fuscella]
MLILALLILPSICACFVLQKPILKPDSRGNGSIACPNPSTHSRLIPGSSNFQFCDLDCWNDIYQVDLIDMTPMFPRLGEPWEFAMQGFFKKDLPVNSTIQVTVKNKSSVVMQLSVDFCNFGNHIWTNSTTRSTCPPPQGRAIFTRAEVIPYFVQEGNYTIVLDSFSPAGERIVCLITSVQLAHS